MTDLLTPSQAAQLCGVTPRTLSRWVAAGRLHPHITLGGHHRYDRDELARAQRQAAVDAAIRRKPLK